MTVLLLLSMKLLCLALQAISIEPKEPLLPERASGSSHQQSELEFGIQEVPVLEECGIQEVADLCACTPVKTPPPHRSGESLVPTDWIPMAPALKFLALCR